ncbi:TAP-like protein-domain-containing protein [Corynascus similis CBS 632.67]
MRSPSRRTLWSASAFILLLTTSATALDTSYHHLLRSRQADDSTFDWDSITPSPDLEYHPCYDNTYQCARLEVPLDWSNPNKSARAAIAIVRLPAAVPVTDPAYGGPVLYNPGGPAGPGTEIMRMAGHWLRDLFDVPGKRHYDVIGFDPRGVWRTTPRPECYGSRFDRAVADFELNRLPSVLSPTGLRMSYELNRGIGELCGEAARATGGDDSIFMHMSTATTARDMLAIVDKSHELKLRKIREETGNGSRATTTKNGVAAEDDEEKPRLQYVAISYGSILGNTFASMFPGRVGRMVVDGIADTEDFNSGLRQKNMQDAEKAVDIFYRTCFDAGELCPLRQADDAGPSDIRARVDNLIRKLEEAPVAAVHNGRAYLVSSLFVREAIRQTFYNPIKKFEPLANTLAGALSSNFSLLLSDPAVISPDTRPEVCVSDEVESYENTGSYLALSCGDSAAEAGDRDFAWVEANVAVVVNQSFTMGEVWATLPSQCAGWPLSSPPYAFHGPFGSAAPDGTDKTPAAPLLILSSRVDHVTPLENAYALSRLHSGSAVVVQESVGHASIISSVSSCTHSIIRDYLWTGKLPKNGTVCEVDSGCKASIPAKECPGLIPI